MELTTALRLPEEEFTPWKRGPYSLGESFLGDRCPCGETRSAWRHRAKERGSNDEEAHPSRGCCGSAHGYDRHGGTAAESGQEHSERRAHVQGTTRGEPDALQDDV